MSSSVFSENMYISLFKCLKYEKVLFCCVFKENFNIYTFKSKKFFTKAGKAMFFKI